ncbi:MAG: hypothetical protein DRN33_01315, partial [Thermoplasmata archaeon]
MPLRYYFVEEIVRELLERHIKDRDLTGKKVQQEAKELREKYNKIDKELGDDEQLVGLDWSEADLNSFNFKNVVLSTPGRQPNFKNSYLSNANLEGADLWGTNLEGADLQNANLKRAILWGANIRGAYLEDAHLGGAKLQNARIEEAHLQGTHLERAN